VKWGVLWGIMGSSGGKWESFRKDLLSSQTLRMLIGTYTHELDPKKRLTLPSKWRAGLGKKVVVTKGLDSALFVFSVTEWEKVASALASSGFGNKDTRDFNRFMLGNAFETDVDAAGRIVIPDQLRTFAKLTEKVVLAGMYSRIELWDEATWNTLTEKVSGEADQLASKLSDLGVI
jgi:MraZ protein